MTLRWFRGKRNISQISLLEFKREELAVVLRMKQFLRLSPLRQKQPLTVTGAHPFRHLYMIKNPPQVQLQWYRCRQYDYSGPL